MLDRRGAQFVVPGLVAIDLAQSVCGAVCGQPRRSIGTEVDRIAGHVRRSVRGGDPSGGPLRRAVLRYRCAKQPVLVFPRTPATVDVELDALVACLGRCGAQGRDQIGREVGYAGILVGEHRDAVRKATIVRDSPAAVVTAEDGTGQPDRRRC